MEWRKKERGNHPKELRSVSVDLCGEKERGKKLLSRWAKLISLNSYARISCRWLTEEICEFACEVFFFSVEIKRLELGFVMEGKSMTNLDIATALIKLLKVFHLSSWSSVMQASL